MTGLAVFKVKKRSFLIVNFPLAIGKELCCVLEQKGIAVILFRVLFSG